MHVRTRIGRGWYILCAKMTRGFVVLTVLVIICGAEWQNGNDGVDRPNGDLLSVPISMKAGATPSDCAQLCYANTQCKAWAFSKPNCSGSTVTAQCYLKAEVTQQSTDPCKVSYMTCNTLTVLCET